MGEVQLNRSWLAHLQPEFDQAYMRELKAFLLAEKQAGKVIYPPAPLWFNALNTTPLDQVRVVVIGQDPYHGPNQAHGLSFSVQDGVRIPPSLQNIYKELARNPAWQAPQSGNLTHWAEQGVLLLNAVLTVEAGQANSHQGKGWEIFTDKIIEVVNAERSGVVFMLWGSYAQKKGSKIDRSKHLVLRAPHPSPLSAHRGFIGCDHFVSANYYLQQQGQSAIQW